MNTLSAEELGADDDATDDEELEEATDELDDAEDELETLADELDEARDELEDAVDELDATLVVVDVVDVVDEIPDEATEVLAELTSLDSEASLERLAEEDEVVTAQEASKNANPTKAMVKNDFLCMVFPFFIRLSNLKRLGI
ncbi:MAG: hypothetical protein NTV44_01195 [Firmicutes bacterium]|nr:hypothetical protein [Bacillota bacterium]